MMTFDPRIVAGKDLEAREARKAARKRAGPVHDRWFKEAEAHVRGERPVKLRQVHVALLRALANYPSANDGYCYASQARLGAAIGAAQRTAQRYFAELVAAGLLSTKRRGFARTSIWVFCIAGEPLFPDLAASDTPRMAASDTPRMAASDTPRMAASDTPRMAYKPSVPEPLEVQPCEKIARAPSPPPDSEPRAKRTGEIAAEIMAAVPADLRKLPIWQALRAWIDATCEDESILPVDVVLGVTTALSSLNGAAPSTLRYFDPPVRRASDARKRPLPTGGAVPVVSLQTFTAYIEREIGHRRGSLAAKVDAGCLEGLHARFTVNAIEIGEAVASVRAALSHGGAV